MDRSIALNKAIDLFTAADQIGGPTSQLMLLVNEVAKSLLDAYTLGEMSGFNAGEAARRAAYDEGYRAGVEAERIENTTRPTGGTQE